MNSIKIGFLFNNNPTTEDIYPQTDTMIFKEDACRDVKQGEAKPVSLSHSQ